MRDALSDKLNSLLNRSFPPAVTYSLSWTSLMPLLTLVLMVTNYLLVSTDQAPEMTTVLTLNFARFRRYRIAGSWYQKPDLHSWTWYGNAGVVAKKIDHILLNIHRVFQSAGFFATETQTQAAY